jgi:hypothetical protein
MLKLKWRIQFRKRLETFKAKAEVLSVLNVRDWNCSVGESMLIEEGI